MNVRKIYTWIIACFLWMNPLWSQYDFTITTIAGDGLMGFEGDGGDPLLAEFTIPAGIDIDPGDTILYVADQCNHRIRKIDLVNNIISTVVGDGVGGHNGNTDPTTSSLLFPGDVYVDKNGDLFIVDSGNSLIKKLEVTTNTLTVIAGTGTAGYNGDGMPATATQLNFPRGIQGDEAGNLYIADYYNHRVRKIDTNGIMTTIAGTGVDAYSGDGGLANMAALNAPRDVTLDYFENIYVTDSHNNRIRRIDAITGIITTFGGSGTAGFSGDGGHAATANFDIPTATHMTEAGNLYIADLSNFRLRNIACDTSITTVAGDGDYEYDGDNGNSLNAGLRYPMGVTVSRSGTIYVVDQNAYVVRSLLPVNNVFCGVDCSTVSLDNQADDFANTANITNGAQLVLFADSLIIEGPSGITTWQIFTNTGLKDNTGTTDLPTGASSTPLFAEVVLGGGRSKYVLVGYIPPAASYDITITDGVNVFPFSRQAGTQIDYLPQMEGTCDCDNSSNVRNVLGESIYFERLIELNGISDAPFEIKSHTGLVDQTGIPLPIGNASQVLFEEVPTTDLGVGVSIYSLQLWHLPGQGFEVVISDGANDHPISSACSISNCIEYNPSISDPCSCANPDNIVDATTGQVRLFADEITLVTLSGLDVEILSQTGMLDRNGTLLPIGTASRALFTEDPTTPGGGASTYTLHLWHAADIGYSVQITDGVSPTFSIGNSCSPCPITEIPLTDHIGLIFIGGLLLGISLLYLNKFQMV